MKFTFHFFLEEFLEKNYATNNFVNKVFNIFYEGNNFANKVFEIFYEGNNFANRVFEIFYKGNNFANKVFENIYDLNLFVKGGRCEILRGVIQPLKKVKFGYSICFDNFVSERYYALIIQKVRQNFRIFTSCLPFYRPTVPTKNNPISNLFLFL